MGKEKEREVREEGRSKRKKRKGRKDKEEDHRQEEKEPSGGRNGGIRWLLSIHQMNQARMVFLLRPEQQGEDLL